MPAYTPECGTLLSGSRTPTRGRQFLPGRAGNPAAFLSAQHGAGPAPACHGRPTRGRALPLGTAAAASQPPVESSPLPLPRTPGGTRATACTRCVWPGTRHPQVLRRPAVSHGHQNDTSRDARCEWQRRIHPPRPGASPLGGTVLPGPASYLRSASCRLHLCYRVLCWHRWDSSR